MRIDNGIIELKDRKLETGDVITLKDVQYTGGSSHNLLNQVVGTATKQSLQLQVLQMTNLKIINLSRTLIEQGATVTLDNSTKFNLINVCQQLHHLQ